MSTSEQQTAWAPRYFSDAGTSPVPGSVAGEAEPNAIRSNLLAVGVFAVLALASAVQAILAPELLSEIFERL